MLPPFMDAPEAPYAILPPGIHWATLEEIEVRFATSERRVWLFEGFVKVVDALQHAGCRRLYLDGSFVTGKDSPNDYDGCWDPIGVIGSRLDPVLLDFTNGRAAQKHKYRGEMFVVTQAGSPGETFLDFFQTERHTGGRKGIVGLQLDSIPGQRP